MDTLLLSAGLRNNVHDLVVMFLGGSLFNISWDALDSTSIMAFGIRHELMENLDW